MKIKLTDTDYKKFYIEADDISAILPVRFGSEIVMKSGKSYPCQETPDEVMRAIREEN